MLGFNVLYEVPENLFKLAWLRRGLSWQRGYQISISSPVLIGKLAQGVHGHPARLSEFSAHFAESYFELSKAIDLPRYPQMYVQSGHNPRK